MTGESLSSHPVPFIGRTEDIGEIMTLVDDPNCRLLTLVGPGGIGKSRLAAEVVNCLSDRFADGTVIVNFQSVTSGSLVPSAIADALNMTLSGHDEPRVQLLRLLAEQEKLLVFDNFEHLVSESDLLTDMLIATERIKLIVTSREMLNLRSEWLYPLKGLPFAEGGETLSSAATYDAAQLFVHHARRMRHDFSLEADLENVTRICRAVQGMPLGIELAASWMKMLSCGEIAQEIEKNLGFLRTNLRDFPSRHRSMRAVFDQSWSYLDDHERTVFKQLAIFRGGFRREAAEIVAGAKLSTLTSLVEKSLLRRETDERYDFHPLLRQYAAEHLAQDVQAFELARKAHSAYFVQFMRQREADLLGGRQLSARHEVATEMDNIRAAWAYLAEHKSYQGIIQTGYALSQFLDFDGRYAELISSFSWALRSLDEKADGGDTSTEHAQALTIVLVSLGWAYTRVAQLDKARHTFERAQAIYEQREISHPPGLGLDPLTGIAVLEMIAGNFAQAMQLGEDALRRHTARVDYQNQALSHYILATATLAQGHYTTAYRHAQQAHTITQAAGDQWFSAYCLNEMGNASYALGDFVGARSYFRESYEIRRMFRDPQGQAIALNGLGKVASAEDDFDEAIHRYSESLMFYRRIGDHGGLVATLTGLADALVAQHRYSEARGHFSEALDIAVEHDLISFALSTLTCIGSALIAQHQLEVGIELLAFVQEHPASEQEARALAQGNLANQQVKLPEEEFRAAYARGANSELEPVSLTAQMALQSLGIDMPNAHDRSVFSPTGSLIDPLSDRELEILALLTEGLSNADIAERLFLALGTVKAHNHSIYSKLGARNRAQAVLRARELGLV